MHYFIDFDRTIFDTESFKRDFKKRATLRELVQQCRDLLAEYFGKERTLSRRRILSRTFGTYASHGRLGFLPKALQSYLYPDVADFFLKHAKETTIVTYGVQTFITAKVTNALSDVALADIVYTPRKKGRTIRRLTKDQEGPFVFIDDAHFQLKDVSRVCPDVEVFEIRRDGNQGDGRWQVVRSLDELPETYR